MSTRIKVPKSRRRPSPPEPLIKLGEPSPATGAPTLNDPWATLAGKHDGDPNWDMLMEAIRENRESERLADDHQEAALYLLDTDVLSLFLHRRAQYPLLEKRIFSTPPELRFVSVVTAEEMIQGAFKVIRRDQQARTGINGYTLLKNILEDLRTVQLIELDAGTMAWSLAFPPQLRRIGRSDCLIAASALQRDFTVVTRNVSDCTRFPGLRVEDWSQPPSV